MDKPDLNFVAERLEGQRTKFNYSDQRDALVRADMLDTIAWGLANVCRALATPNGEKP